jgi:hypothetical protein
MFADRTLRDRAQVSSGSAVSFARVASAERMQRFATLTSHPISHVRYVMTTHATCGWTASSSHGVAATQVLSNPLLTQSSNSTSYDLMHAMAAPVASRGRIVDEPSERTRDETQHIAAEFLSQPAPRSHAIQ